MTSLESVPEQEISLETELAGEDASREIAEAVSIRNSIARNYVRWMRGRFPDASPAEIIKKLEKHYVTSITTAGAILFAGGIAAEIGINLIPYGSTVQGVGKGAMKLAAKNAALGFAKNAAEKGATALLPAGEEQLQFEITAIFGLALSEIHNQSLDKEQAHALVLGLTSDRVKPQEIAAMATDISYLLSEDPSDSQPDRALGTTKGTNWAHTLAKTLPGEGAQRLVRTLETGQLDELLQTIPGKHATTIEYGVGVFANGTARFVFGQEVVTASQLAFGEAPDTFPAQLALDSQPESDDGVYEPNQALAALEEAAKTSGDWIVGTAGMIGEGIAVGAVAVGTGATIAADVVSRPFRKVDLDGDGIPDEAQALTLAKDVGGAIANTAGTVGGVVAEKAGVVGGAIAETAGAVGENVKGFFNKWNNRNKKDSDTASAE